LFNLRTYSSIINLKDKKGFVKRSLRAKKQNIGLRAEMLSLYAAYPNNPYTATLG